MNGGDILNLTIDQLTKQYQNKIAVDRLSLKLAPGIYGLLGANGAGKTTLMRMICGILKPTSGTISYNGTDIQSEHYRDVLGYLPQDFGYYPDFTAMEFLLYMASLKGIPKKMAKEKSKELLEVVSLSDVSKKKIKKFSGGMKQRLGIAQALLNNPEILILDEPTAGLDPKERVRFRNLISQLGMDRIVLLSTHIVSDVENIANTILIMKDGQLLENGSLLNIVQPIENKIWECRVPEYQFEKLSRNFTVINIRNETDGVLLRLVADEKPYENAVAVKESLEDLYLYYFSGEDQK